jgi:hypothetical protein
MTTWWILNANTFQRSKHMIFWQNYNLNPFDDKHILKYKKDMEDIVTYICHCCGRLCFAFLISQTSKSYVEVFLEIIKIIDFKNHLQMWKEYLFWQIIK